MPQLEKVYQAAERRNVSTLPFVTIEPMNAAETQRLTRHYEQKQAALAALKKSFHHQVFTGEL